MRLLLIEDDQSLSRQLASALRQENFAVDQAFDGEEGHYQGDVEPYDAVILDIGLPVMNGIEVLKSWRKDERNMPVLILTARDNWQEKVEGFEAGADDYVTKPFQLEEVIARVRALIRRSSGLASPVLTCGPITLDTHSGEVQVNSQAVSLTAYEHKLISYLMHHQGEVVSRTILSEHIYEQDYDPDSNTLEVFVGRLRKKLNVPNIKTVRGRGYQLVEQA